jgi:hypothetical protein
MDGLHAGEDGFAVLHITDHALERLEGLKNYTLVTTDRDFMDMMDSWERRGRDLAELPDYVVRWEKLLEMGAVVVSIDGDRNKRLRNLSQVLGVNLETDWVPVNAWSGNG